MNTPANTTPLSRLWALGEFLIRRLEDLQPLAQLAARYVIAGVFFRSGLTKIDDWETTVALFTYEYQVPLLSPEVAAALATSAELVLPALLLFGLAGRFAALGLFILNIVAVISVAEMPVAALQQHIFWGSLLLGLLLWGPGRWSLDRFVWPWAGARLLGSTFSAGAVRSFT